MTVRKLVRVTWILVLVTAVYSGFIVWSRWHERRVATEQQQERERENARHVVDTYGGNRLTILHFYATEAIVRPGTATTLCYGVSNAASVRIEPTVADVWPSISRCLEVRPKQSTTYKLLAEDKAGHEETAVVVIQVK
jgi:hypothetical protein